MNSIMEDRINILINIRSNNFFNYIAQIAISMNFNLYIIFKILGKIRIMCKNNEKFKTTEILSSINKYLIEIL